VAADSFLNSKIVQVEVEDGEGEEEESYPGLSQGSDMGNNSNNRKQAGAGAGGGGRGGRGGEEEEEDAYTQSEGVRKLRKCPEAVDAFKVLWTVSKSAAQHDIGKYCNVPYSAYYAHFVRALYTFGLTFYITLTPIPLHASLDTTFVYIPLVLL
jgi:hypothetical protein